MEKWFSLAILFSAIFLLIVDAKTTTLDWSLSYVTAAPNGVSRPVIGVNKAFPPPTIVVNQGDVVEIRVTNDFTDGESVSLHAHGIFQKGTNFYDGVPMVTEWYVSHLNPI